MAHKCVWLGGRVGHCAVCLRGRLPSTHRRPLSGGSRPRHGPARYRFHCPNQQLRPSPAQSFALAAGWFEQWPSEHGQLVAHFSKFGLARLIFANALCVACALPFVGCGERPLYPVMLFARFECGERIRFEHFPNRICSRNEGERRSCNRPTSRASRDPAGNFPKLWRRRFVRVSFARCFECGD